jgi:hypothetical protein
MAIRGEIKLTKGKSNFSLFFIFIVMNLNENINRIKEVMGLINEVVDVNDDSYVSMNIKNFPRYKNEVTELLKDKLNNSNGDFVTFKNLVIVGYDENKTPILSDDLKVDNKFLNYMVSMGHKKFNSLLYSIFSDYFGMQQQTNNTKSNVVDCDPSELKLVGPLVEKGGKSLFNYGITEKGGKVYRIKLPDECLNKLTPDDKRMYITLEPTENRVHFPHGVPEVLRGKKIGTIVYLKMIKKLGYITSSMGNSPEIKMVYNDLLTNPKYSEDVMSLLLLKQVLIFDVNTNLDVKQIFNDYVLNKFTDKKSVRISPKLREILGDDFTSWYESLEETPEKTIDDKIKKYEGQEPKGGDHVVDTTTNKIYSFNFEWEDNGKKLIQLSSDKYETLLLPAEEKKRFKVIHRSN